MTNDLRNRFPNLSLLSIALLEHFVEPVLGRDAINVIKEPYLRNSLEEALSAAFVESERKFIEEYHASDPDLLQAMLNMPVRNVPSLQQAVIDFYHHPADPALRGILRDRMVTDLPRVSVDRIERAVELFLHILTLQLFNSIPEFRPTLGALASLEQVEILRQMLDRMSGFVSQVQAEPGSGAAPAESRPRRHDFYSYINVPDHYIERTDVLSDVRDAVLSTAGAGVGGGMPLALHGLGGIGKSALARALCDDPLVQAAFPDGILWATLGNEATQSDLIQKLRDWIGALGGTISENAPSLDSLKNALAGLLSGAAVLLILDDIWHKKHADAFRVGGSRCGMLITTRDAEIARDLGAKVTRIPTMETAAGVKLLQAWAEGSLDDADPELLAQIVGKLGGLPLAIKLAGAQLRSKSPERWLDTFNARQLKARRAEGEVHDSLEKTFGISLDELGDTERHLYAALSIFKDDERIHEAGIRRLWQALGRMDEDDAGMLLDDLASRALVEVATEQYPRAVVLHDLLRGLMREELGEEQQSEAHLTLVEAYRQTQRGEGWPTAPDDGYLYTHLAFHLLKAGCREELYALLTDSPAWMRASVGATGGYIACTADLGLAMEEFDDPLAPNDLLSVFKLHTARQIIHAQVSLYEDDDLKILTLIGQGEKALVFARLRKSKEKRISGLLIVAEHSPSPLRQTLIEEARRVAWSHSNNDDQSSGLYDVAEALAKAQQIERALEVVRDISTRSIYVDALVIIAKQLVETGQTERALHMLDEAADASTDIEEGYHRGSRLAYIAATLKDMREPERAVTVLDRAVASIEADPNIKPADQDWTLNTVAETLAELGKLEKAQEVASQIRDTSLRIRTLAEVAVHFGKVGQLAQAEFLLDAALALVDRLPDSSDQSTALGFIATALALIGQVDRGLALLQRSESPFARSYELRDLASALAKAGQIDIALETGKGFQDESHRSVLLESVVTALVQADQIEQALETASSISEIAERCGALKSIAEKLVELGDTPRALDVAHSISDSSQRATALRMIAIKQAQEGQVENASEVLKEILAATLDAAKISDHVYHLCAIVSQLAQAGQSEQALSLVKKAYGLGCTILNREARSSAKQQTAYAAAEVGEIDWALEVAQNLENEAERPSTVRIIAASIAATGHFDRALQIVQEIDNATARGWGLRDIGNKLADKGETQRAKQVFEEALSSAEKISKPSDRIWLMSDVAEQLATHGEKEHATHILDRLITEVQEIDDPDDRSWLTKMMTSALAEAGQIDQALAVARGLKDSSQRAEALGLVASVLVAGGQTTLALAVIDEIEGDNQDWEVQSLVGKLVRVGEVELALDRVKRIKDSFRKASAQQQLVTVLVDAGQPYKALEVARMIDNDGFHNQVYPLALVSDSLVKSDPNGALAILEEAQAVMAQIAVIWTGPDNVRIAKTLGRLGLFRRALNIIDGESLEDLFRTLSEWISPIDAKRPGLFVEVLDNVLRIYAWQQAI